MHTHEYGNALLKEDFAADSLQYELDLSKTLDITCPVRIIHGLNDREIPSDQSMKVNNLFEFYMFKGKVLSWFIRKLNYHINLEIFKLCLSLASEDVDLIYRKNSTHQLESPPDLELFLTTLDRYWLPEVQQCGGAGRIFFIRGCPLRLKKNSFCPFLFNFNLNLSASPPPFKLPCCVYKYLLAFIFTAKKS